MKIFILFFSLLFANCTPAYNNIIAETGNSYMISVTDFGAKGDGKTDDTKAIQKAFEASRKQQISRNGDGKGGRTKVYYGSTPPVKFPHGTYLISESIEFGHYQSIQGEDAVIIPSDSFKGTAFHGVGWQLKIEGLQFVGFSLAINIDNKNLDAGQVIIRNCSFLSNLSCVSLSAKSSLSVIEQCRFIDNASVLIVEKGDKVVFTSLRSGDLELYTADLDGSNVKQITDELGYDGGAFFSPDGSKIIFRASRPKTEEDIKEYKDLLAQGLVQPTNMELFICNADGSELRQLTDLGNANWCPFFHPSGEKVIFASNHESERGFPFNLYMINTDGTGLERVTKDGTFDAFPVFSNNGKYLVFSSNRNNGGTRETNLFVAEWKD